MCEKKNRYVNFNHTAFSYYNDFLVWSHTKKNKNPEEQKMGFIKSSFYKDITQQEYYLQERWDLNLSAKKIISNKNISSLLDIGCGYGAFLHKIIQERPDIACHGFDPNPSVSGSSASE